MKSSKIFKNGVPPLSALENQKGISTRSKSASMLPYSNNKRKAEASPPGEKRKRSALGNLTNANASNVNQVSNEKKSKVHVQKTFTRNRAISSIPEENENILNSICPVGKNPVTKIQTRSSKIQSNVSECLLPIAKSKEDFLKPLRRLTTSEHIELKTVLDQKNENVCKNIPEDVEDFDKENWNDPFQVAIYAMDIFNYLKEREKDFIVSDYMHKQIHLSKWMRALLVDWMVEVQECFELNHETLYLAVKLVDTYLCSKVIQKDSLQLLGAASLLIACKFDERTPPLVEDFLYICDGAYKQKELLTMEMQVLKTIGFDLSMPLSYRFLRRYARCAKVSMPILTLARFILEFSLMDYGTIQLSDSKLACAALFIAMRMSKLKGWNKTLEYFSGYKFDEFDEIVLLLNNGLHKKPKESLNTIRNKYSHKIFHEVAKIPLMTNATLMNDA
uniref:CSON003545 protein n=1 Tax=Culicoides sonorensis TaxID=179676 RepID=A0A336MP55_CULSO